MIFNVLKANARVKELEADNANLVKALADKEKDFDALVKDATELSGIKGEHSKAIEALKAEHATAIENLTAEHAKAMEALKAELATAQTSAKKEAANIVANLGLQEGTIKESISQSLTDEQLKAKYEAMSAGKEKDEFYKKHREQILRAHGYRP